MIYQEVTAADFIDAFRAYGRQDQFSYAGLHALFDYLEEEYDGEYWELDVIALCCEYTEATYDDIRQTYRDVEDIEDDGELREWLGDHTLVIYVDDDTVIYQDF